MTSVFVANSSIFLPPLLLCADWKILSFISLLLPATGAGWRIGARGTIQTEAFWNKGGDLTSAPRLAEQRDRVHRAGREVDNCRRPSFEVPHRSGTWEGVWGGGSLCWLVGTEPDKEKPEPQPVWGVIPVADNKGSEKGLCVCFLWISAHVCVCAHCQPYTHTPTSSYHGHKSTGPKIVTACRWCAHLSGPNQLTDTSGKRSFSARSSVEIQTSRKQTFALCNADFFDIWQ